MSDIVHVSVVVPVLKKMTPLVGLVVAPLNYRVCDRVVGHR
jgi:hypothetical protein